jgi:hypothetical protein
MTEFTSEWIAEQKNIISKASPLPWSRCNCGKCADIMSIPLDAEVADLLSHQDGCKEEGFPYSKKHMEDVDLIVVACNNYPETLDHIERLQSRVQELEGLLDVVEDKKQTVFEVLKNTITRRDEYIVKLENKISDINLHLAKANLRVQELEDEKQAVWKEWLEETKKMWDEEDKQGLKNKCANCGLAIPHGIWGDEDNDYDNLPKLPQEGE